MFPQSLRQLLAEPFSPELVGRAAILCDEWFAAKPCITAFTLRAIFAELAGQWDDEQGTPTERVTPFQEHLAPLLVQLVGEAADGVPTKAGRDSLDTLVRVFQECRHAAGY